MASRGRGATVKGRDFERRVAKALTPLLGVGKLRRVYISESTDHVRYPGDICRVDGGTMPVVVECKAQKFDLADVVLSHVNILTWMAQALQHSHESGIGGHCIAVPWRGHIALIHPKDQAWWAEDRLAEIVGDNFYCEILRELK